MDPAVMAVIGVVIGTVLGAGLQEWRARNDEARAIRQQRRQRVAELNLQRLVDTRRSIWLATDYTLNWALADDADVERASKAAHAARPDLSDNALIVDDSAIVRWLAAREIVMTRGRRRGNDLTLIQEVYDSRDACFDAIDRQIERALEDRPLLGLGPEARAAIAKAMIVTPSGLHPLHHDAPPER
jgi:hypothetical protein